MDSKSGTGTGTGTGLRLLQLTLRAVLLASAAIILGIYSYFLAALTNHALPISNTIRAVEGIAGSAVLYAVIAIVLLSGYCCCCCCRASTDRNRSRLPPVSLLALVLNAAFAAAFIYVAVANKGGAGTCGGEVDTPFGKGKGGDTVKASSGGFTALPTFRTACQLQTACLAVSIIAIFFFLFSLLAELAFIRHRRQEKRSGPGPVNDYNTSGGGGGGGGVGFFARLFGHRAGHDSIEGDENMLPKHTTPGELGGTGNPMTQNTAYDSLDLGRRPSEPPYNPDYLPLANDGNPQETGHGYGYDYGYGYSSPLNAAPAVVGGHDGHSSSSPYQRQEPPQGYRYDDGIYDRV